MNKQYQSLIFTNHSLERLSSRSITQAMVWQVVSHPTKQYAVDKDKVKFIGTVNERLLHVVAQRIEKENKWLIISTWVRGENDSAPIAWRIITFPFWLVWLLLSLIWKTVFSKSKK